MNKDESKSLPQQKEVKMDTDTTHDDSNLTQPEKNDTPKIIGVENAVSLQSNEEEKEEEMPMLGYEHYTIEEKIELALHTVYDPEIPVNIMELGLVYNIEVKENNTVFILMTLTAPGCPVAGDIVVEVENKIRAIKGVTDVHVQLTFEPQWNKDMMTEEAKLELGFL